MGESWKGPFKKILSVSPRALESGRHVTNLISSYAKLIKADKLFIFEWIPRRQPDLSEDVGFKHFRSKHTRSVVFIDFIFAYNF